MRQQCARVYAEDTTKLTETLGWINGVENLYVRPVFDISSNFRGR